MIDEGLQAEIRAAYQKLTDSLNLLPRWGQRQMIAEVANALADPEAETPIAVVEAGTGTGKTIAYLVAALPIARARGMGDPSSQETGQFGTNYLANVSAWLPTGEARRRFR